MLALKDFAWTKQGDKWEPDFCALGKAWLISKRSLAT
jgi:hypothetical protein